MDCEDDTESHRVSMPSRGSLRGAGRSGLRFETVSGPLKSSRIFQLRFGKSLDSSYADHCIRFSVTAFLPPWCFQKSTPGAGCDCVDAERTWFASGRDASIRVPINTEPCAVRLVPCTALVSAVNNRDTISSHYLGAKEAICNAEWLESAWNRAVYPKHAAFVPSVETMETGAKPDVPCSPR